MASKLGSRPAGALALAAAIALGGAACGTGPDGDPSLPGVVTPLDAHERARAGLAALSAAWVEHRPEAMGRVTTGAALTLYANELARSVADGAIAGAPIPAPDAVEVFVPRRAAFPAHFLARISYPPETGRRARLAVFESAGDPTEGIGGWKLAAVVVQDGDRAIGRRIALDGEGYAASAVGIGPHAPALDPDLLASSLAAYLNRHEEAEVPSSPVFGAGDQTTGRIEAIRAYRTASEESGTAWTTRFSPSGFPAYAYRTADGGAVVLFSVRERQHWSSPDGGPITVSPEVAASLGVRPGTYETLDQERLTLHAVLVPPKGAAEAVEWLGAVVTQGAWIVG